MHQKHQLAYPVAWVGTPLPDASDALLEAAGYVQLVTDGDWFRPSGTSTLDAAHFYHPTAVTDPFGNVTTLTWDADDLLPESVEDALGNVVTADNDYQALAPHTVTDPNGTEQQVAFDPLGRVVKTAIVGPSGEGDSLAHPTTEITYDLASLPVSATVVSREVHYAESTTTRFQTAVAYSDGGGNVIQTKTTAAPSQWVGTGRVQVDNKGNPVRQYEPFFSATSDYEDEDDVVATGVSVTITYDALSRKIRVDHPDGTFETVGYATWSQTTSDRCDTVMESDWYADRSSSSDPLVVRSVARSVEHAETPSVVHVDVLGRPFRTVETPDGTEEYVTDTVLDLLGRTTAVIDARGNTTQADVYDAIGRSVHSTSPDAGETRVGSDVAGQPVRTWKSGSVVVTQTYDALRRPRATLDGTRVHVFNVYGEFDATEHALGRLWRQYDGAGLVELAYDFAGNVVSSTRTFLDDVDTEVDWVDLLDDADVATLDATAAGDLQGSGFTTTTTFDALKRVVTSTTPDDSVTRNTWDEGGRLSAVDVQIRGSSTWTPMVGAIEHDAKGQRTRIEYPGFATDYTYDAETFRLVRLETVRDSDDAVLQDLTYTYDAAGNIVQITDAAQQTLFFDNSVVSPTTKYKYDALYRLTSAEGREHGSLSQPAHGDPALGDLPHDNDGSAVRTYLETYVYDEVGNILRMKHQGGTEASPGSVLWHRGYLYDDDSNVLLKTSLPGDDVEDPDTYSATAYAVNARGAMTEMPHLAGITRQFDDQMRNVDLGSGDDAVYHYDAAGQRVRKVVRTGSTTKERLYLGAWERFQRSTTTLQEERDTLHVMDNRRRIVMIETLTVDGGSTVTTPAPRQRFQLGNHLDSAALEVDEDGALITYEEYHPYGTTAWWASNGSTEVSAKRYRYTGMERDEETGLGRHGVRSYCAWLGRWERVDPIGLKGGINRFEYCRSKPTKFVDVDGRDPGFPLVTLFLLEGATPETVGGTALVAAAAPKPHPPPAPAPGLLASAGTAILAGLGFGALLAGPALELRQGQNPKALDYDYKPPTDDDVVLSPFLLDSSVPGSVANLIETRAGGILPRVAATAPPPAALDEPETQPQPEIAPDAAKPGIKAGISTATKEKKEARGSVNLDTGTLIALSTRGGLGREVRESIGDRRMFSTTTALAEFQDIVAKHAGPSEMAAAMLLLEEVTAIPTAPSSRFAAATPSGGIGRNDLDIFGTGDRLGIETFTGDAAAVRALPPELSDVWVNVHDIARFEGR